MDDKGRTLYIIIGCDTDPDRPGFIEGVSGGRLSWRGLSEGIPSAKEAVKGILDDEGRSPVFTWLLRVDEQIEILAGEYNSVLREYKNLLIDLEASGDEIGWHPHFFKYNKDRNIWYQELNDREWQCEMLESAFESFGRVFPERPASARTGWTYHNNETMRKLNDLGLKVDFSAIPGLRTLSKKKVEFPLNLYDWYNSPKSPYHPSSNDYRRAAANGEKELSILEAPNFVSDSFFWGMISGIHLARKMKDSRQIFQAIRKPAYWINLTGAPRLFSPIINTLGRKLRDSSESKIFFVTYFHADELLENTGSLYRMEHLRQNLKDISEICIRSNVAVKFLKAGEMPGIVDLNEKPR